MNGDYFGYVISIQAFCFFISCLAVGRIKKGIKEVFVYERVIIVYNVRDNSIGNFIYLSRS